MLAEQITLFCDILNLKTIWLLKYDKKNIQ